MVESFSNKHFENVKKLRRHLDRTVYIKHLKQICEVKRISRPVIRKIEFSEFGPYHNSQRKNSTFHPQF